jgi:hypothetical protein
MDVAFGSGHDISIYDNCNTITNSYTNVGAAFDNALPSKQHKGEVHLPDDSPLAMDPP